MQIVNNEESESFHLRESFPSLASSAWICWELKLFICLTWRKLEQRSSVCNPQSNGAKWSLCKNDLFWETDHKVSFSKFAGLKRVWNSMVYLIRRTLIRNILKTLLIAESFISIQIELQMLKNWYFSKNLSVSKKLFGLERKKICFRKIGFCNFQSFAFCQIWLFELRQFFRFYSG